MSEENAAPGYEILWGNSADDLVLLVNQKVDDGFVLVGGLVVIVNDGKFDYFQAVAPPFVEYDLAGLNDNDDDDDDEETY